MPTYDFRDTNTGEVITKLMKISDKEQYLVDNPHLQNIIGAPSIGDPVRLRVRKADNGFKEVLQKIHSKTSGSALNSTADI